MPNWTSNRLRIQTGSFSETELKKISELKEIFESDRPFNKIIPFVFSNGRQIIIATLPTLFIEITYKDSEKDTFMINHEVFLYEEDYPTMEALENYKNKFDFNFASQVNKEVYEIVEAFHQGYGCYCLSSEG